jgi:hypothetical protein
MCGRSREQSQVTPLLNPGSSTFWQMHQRLAGMEMLQHLISLSLPSLPSRRSIGLCQL